MIIVGKEELMIIVPGSIPGLTRQPLKGQTGMSSGSYEWLEC